MTLHEEIVHAYHSYIKEIENFETKGVKISAQRARTALNQLGKLIKPRRREIQEQKNDL